MLEVLFKRFLAFEVGLPHILIRRISKFLHSSFNWRIILVLSFCKHNCYFSCLKQNVQRLDCLVQIFDVRLLNLFLDLLNLFILYLESFEICVVKHHVSVFRTHAFMLQITSVGNANCFQISNVYIFINIYLLILHWRILLIGVWFDYSNSRFEFSKLASEGVSDFSKKGVVFVFWLSKSFEESRHVLFIKIHRL